MPISEHDLEALAALRRAALRAERLDERVERLRPGIVEAGGEAVSDAVAAALAPWARAFSGGDLAALGRRLEWDGIAPALAAAALRAPEVEPRHEMPGWLDAALAWDLVGRDLSADSDRPRLEAVPFPELWRPWVKAALGRLTARAPELQRMSSASREELGSALGVELGRVSERAAFELFERERQARPLGAGAYRAFTDEQLRRGLLPLYLEFPVLLRQSAELAEQFVAAWSELFERWRNDRAALVELFGTAAEVESLESLESITPLDSDRHGGGRRVARLRLAEGFELIYKPRPVAAEARWAELCGELRAGGLVEAPPAARVVERDGYGWMELVRRSDPPDDEALALWFRRAGATLALADLLGVEDLHAENLIATAEGPVAVDLELVLRPARAPRDLERGSPFDTGLVARGAELARGGRVARWAGFGVSPRDGATTAGAARGWAALGSDDLHPVELAASPPPWTNLPRFEGRAVVASERVAELVGGFRATYRFLLARRDDLLAPGGALARFGGIATRLLFRASQDYATLLDRLTAPAAQRDGVSGGLLLEAALRPFAGALERPRLWPLVARERSALEALDLPRFEAVSDSDCLPLGLDGRRSSALRGALLESGAARMRRRFALWGEPDLAAHAAELERELTVIRRESTSAGIGIGLGSGRDARSPDRFECAARVLVSRIARRRIELGRETPEAAGGDLARAVRRASLYDGLAGEALLLSALPAPWRDGAIDQAETLARESFGLAVAELAENKEVPLGAMQGAGSWLWSLAWLERLGRQSPGGELARRLLAALSPDRLAADRRLDLEGGLAGLVLGLLAADQIWPGGGAQELALRAGELLLERAEPAKGGLAWRGEAGRPLAGFAHGASGIARALAALARAGGGPRFADAAAAALGFERALFDSARNNWPVLLADATTGEARSTWMTAWCHGAAGIGLARLLIGGNLESELEAAMEATASAGAAPRDHLCCGSAGRASILALAAGARSRPDWRATAEAIADAIVERASAQVDFELPRGDDPLAAADWGMMRGRVGVAWMLTELAGSGSTPLPSVLALELPDELARRTLAVATPESGTPAEDARAEER